MACNRLYASFSKWSSSHARSQPVPFTSSCSVLKTVVDKDVETTVHKQEVICRTAINSSNCDDLGCQLVKVIHRLQAFFYTDKHVAQSLCHSRAFCYVYWDGTITFLSDWNITIALTYSVADPGWEPHAPFQLGVEPKNAVTGCIRVG